MSTQLYSPTRRRMTIGEKQEMSCARFGRNAPSLRRQSQPREILPTTTFTPCYTSKRTRKLKLLLASPGMKTTEFQSWESDTIILMIGEDYANVLERNRKLIEARNQCETVYTPSKTLALQRKDQASLTTALRRGRSLLDVMKIRPTNYGSGYNNVGYDARSKQLQGDIEQLAELKKK
jgi:hypothetical protein